MVDGREGVLSRTLRQSLPQTQQLRKLDILRATFNRTQPMCTSLWQNMSTLCSLALTALIYIVMARSLGPQRFGSCLFTQWLAAVTIPIIGTGMSMLSSRQLAATQSRESPRLIAGIFYFLWYRQHRSILLYCLIYLGLALLLPHILHLRTFSSGLLLLSSLAAVPLLLSSIAGTTLRSLRRADLLIMLHLSGSLLTLLFVILANQIAGRPIEAFILAFAFSSTITLILAVVCVIRLLPLGQAIQPSIFLRERLAQILNPSWLHFISDAIVWQRCELLLLAYWHDSAQIGFYALSASISTWVLGSSPALFTRWLFPLVLRYFPEHRYLNPYDAFVKTSCYITFLAVPLCAIIMLLCPGIIACTLGPAYTPVIQPLRILLIAAVFGSVATVSLTHLAAIQCNVQRTQQRLNLSIAVSKILLALPLVWLWGLTGAALASAIAQIASALASILLCHKLLRHHENAG
jgi:Membrane protein involved in the export of O-antigen and teichoic acid